MDVILLLIALVSYDGSPQDHGDLNPIACTVQQPTGTGR